MTPAFGRDRAKDLGTRALADVVDGTLACIVALDARHCIVYANAAACRLLRSSPDRLRGRDLLGCVPPQRRADLAMSLEPQPARAVGTVTTLIGEHESTAREVSGSVLTVDTGASPVVILTLWDVSRPHSAARRGAALVQTAALSARGSTTGLLNRIARYAVENTRAAACGIAVAGEDDRFVDGGVYAEGLRPASLSPDLHGPSWTTISSRPAAQVVEAMTGGAIVLGAPPGRPVVVTGARQKWQRNQGTRDYVQGFAELPWSSVIAFPLAWKERVIGLCNLYLPPDVAAIDDGELAFVTAVADHAALAVTNARLAAEAVEAAALSERARLARELHDSVSQALFSMTMHARAAKLAMGKAGVDDAGPLGRSLAELSGLARQALGEMRALIFELRPDALAEEGLLAALRLQATALAARGRLAIIVDGPDRRAFIAAATEEALYRIAVEALHWIVEHGRATEASVTLESSASATVVTISGNGAAPDRRVLDSRRTGSMSMAEHARAVGARLSIDERAGARPSIMVVAPC